MPSRFDRRFSIFTLRDRSGRILLQKRDSKAPRYPDHWGFFGGEIEEGETPRQALLREAEEELGLVKVKFRFFGRYETVDDDGLHEKFLFTAPLRHTLEELRKGQREGGDLGMVSWEDLQGLRVPKGDWVLHRELFGRSRRVGVLEVEKGRGR